jgi:membrane-bound ClpP family serine protease
MVTPMVVPAVIGALLLLIGLGLFVVDLHVTNHGLPTAGGIVTLLAGGLVLLWAGVPYAGVLLGALGVVVVLMGACSSGCWDLRAPSEGGRLSPVRRG